MHVAFRGKDVLVSYGCNPDRYISGTGYIDHAYDGYEPDNVLRETLDTIEQVDWSLHRGIERATYKAESFDFNTDARYREKEFFDWIVSQEKSSLCGAIKCHLYLDGLEPPRFSLGIFAEDKMFEQLCERFTDVMRSNFLEYRIRINFLVASREKALAPHWTEICQGAHSYTTDVDISFQKRFNVEDQNFFKENVKKHRW